MARTVIDSVVMRDKATTIGKAADDIYKFYEDMLKVVQTTAGQMKGNTIEAQKKAFEGMNSTFLQFKTDMQTYKDFLIAAAEGHEKVEASGTQKASDQGKIF